MALSEKSRSALYQGFVPIVGEEAIAEMLGQFPARDVEEMVTREHLDRRFAELRGELRAEMHQLGTRLYVSLTATMIAFLAVAVTVLSLVS